MALLLELGLAVLALLVLWQWLSYRKRRSMPPGEYGWPIIGRFPPRNKSLREFIFALRQKYGDIFTWKFGIKNIVVLCDYHIIREVFNQPESQNRPVSVSFDIGKQSNNMGIFNVNGKNFHMSRRFTVRHLKDMGMGRSVMEDAILLQARNLITEFRAITNKPAVVPRSLGVAMLNILSKMISDQQFELSDKRIQDVQRLVAELLDGFQRNVMFFDLFPYLVPFTPKFIYDWMGVTSFIETSKKYDHYIRSVVEEHKKTLDPDHPRDFIDFFLIENMKDEHKGDDAYTEENVVVTVNDIFLAGSESTSSMTRWLILYMAKYPEVQARMQAELDQVVPRDRLPGLQDKDKLNYTVAVMHELERLVSFTSIVFHCANAPMKIQGYSIPENTTVIGYLSCCHADPKYWEKPDQLYPEHFLDDQGKFKMNKDGFIPFSAGRRVCPGENLAQLVIFLIASALLQNFTFSAPVGVTISTDRYKSERVFNFPTEQEIIIKERA